MSLTRKEILELIIEHELKEKWLQDAIKKEDAHRDLRTRRANWVTQRIQDIPDMAPAMKNDLIKKLFERAEKEVM